jgi:hypothetical protein
MSPTERDLVDASDEIGRIAESAGWFLDILAMQVSATGKHVDELTVGELRAIYREKRERTNQILRSTQPGR